MYRGAESYGNPSMVVRPNYLGSARSGIQMLQSPMIKPAADARGSNPPTRYVTPPPPFPPRASFTILKRLTTLKKPEMTRTCDVLN